MGFWMDSLKLIRTACKMDPATFIMGKQRVSFILVKRGMLTD